LFEENRGPANVVNDLVLISYDSGMPGQVTSEWLDDKLRVLGASGAKVSIVTRPDSKLVSSKDFRIHRPYSISWRDFSSEVVGSGFSGRAIFVLLIAGTLGRLFDFLFEKLAGSYSWGKWSWIFLAFPKALFASLKSSSKVVFTTGGPSSAHFVGLLVSLVIPKTRLYVELQDPFIGTEMTLNPRSRRVLLYLEHILVSRATKVVFVTETAAERARARYGDEKLKSKIVAIYPGSWNFQIKSTKTQSYAGNKITFMHVGSLYTSRNLDLFFEALDNLKRSGHGLADKVQVINQGDLNLENRSTYLQRRDFQVWPVVGREDALTKAVDADFLLLVQHSDSRSEETIPYKTYDYLNLQIPIFGLTNNHELDDLISKSSGFVGSSTKLDQTVDSLRKALSSIGSGGHKNKKGVYFDIVRQFAQMFH